ncbi:hypothetical protein LTR33_000132 [Friedmanniomyces endolithicus]|nr:hypothetical protein LTR03_017074 [Friedmanniomyces endolithicus]KAK1089253.1 hypothetical protein LTR33_000132 [Friedmanniomyces endolithicus]
MLTNIKSEQEITLALHPAPSPPLVRPAAEEPEVVSALTASYMTKFKEVNEEWEKVTYKYKTVDPSTLSNIADEYNQYFFVVRTRIGTYTMSHKGTSAEASKHKETKLSSLFVAIKFRALQQMFLTVLQEGHGISLQEDNPTVEGNVLSLFHPELKAYRDRVASEESLYVDEVDVLLDYIESAYSSTAGRLRSLLERNEITYDLLWVLFKPKAEIYTTCPGTEQPMCVRCNHEEEKKPSNRPNSILWRFGISTMTRRPSEKPLGSLRSPDYAERRGSTCSGPTLSSITDV